MCVYTDRKCNAFNQEMWTGSCSRSHAVEALREEFCSHVISSTSQLIMAVAKYIFSYSKIKLSTLND